MIPTQLLVRLFSPYIYNVPCFLSANPFVLTHTVMTDFDTMIMQPLDPVLDDFIADDTAAIAFAVSPPADTPGTFITSTPTAQPVSTPTAPPPTSAPIASIPPDNTVDMGLVLLKPDANLAQNITDAYMNTPYDPVTGWDGSGVGNFNALPACGRLRACSARRAQLELQCVAPPIACPPGHFCASRACFSMPDELPSPITISHH